MTKSVNISTILDLVESIANKHLSNPKASVEVSLYLKGVEVELEPLDFEHQPKDFQALRSELEKEIEEYATNGLFDVRQLSIAILDGEEVLEEHDYLGEDL